MVIISGRSVRDMDVSYWKKVVTEETRSVRQKPKSFPDYPFNRVGGKVDDIRGQFFSCIVAHLGRSIALSLGQKTGARYQ